MKKRMRIHEILKHAEDILQIAGIQEYKNDSFLLFEFVFEIGRADYFMKMNDDVLTIHGFETLYEIYLDKINLRAKHIPLQYITGQQEFMGLDFFVNENVLIPRQDTEILVEKALKWIKKEWNENPGKTIEVLDMCTGSGCIAISVARLSKELYSIDDIFVTAVDLSEEALEVAKKNRENNQCKIEFIQSDLFTELKEKQFDIIISNPPYIKSDVIPTLMEEVKDFEPMMALDGAKDGLKFYIQITKECVSQLKSGGALMYEIGCDQGMDVSNILDKNGFADIQVYKDYAGLDRVVTGTKR